MAQSSTAEQQAPARRAALRLRAAISCAVLLALALSAHREIRSAGLGIGRLAAARIHTWRSYEKSFNTPDTGRDTLPPGVIAAIAQLKTGNAAGFRVAPGLADDAFLAQRLSEMAWPLVIDPQSAFVVRKASEPAVCTLLSEAAGVAVDRCD